MLIIESVNQDLMCCLHVGKIVSSKEDSSTVCNSLWEHSIYFTMGLGWVKNANGARSHSLTLFMVVTWVGGLCSQLEPEGDVE